MYFTVKQELRSMLKIPDRAIAAFEHFTKTDVVA